MTLSERQERILKVLVEEYLTTGRPVGSGTVLDHSHLNISSATIRNELVVLEEIGLILQLHISGGRIPTSEGYRYYVGYLLPTPLLSNDDQMTIRHQFHQAQTELSEWLNLATAVISHRAHNVALITSPRADTRFKHIELIEAQTHTVLIIVVLADGTVKQEMMAVDESVSRESLRDYADYLNQRWRGPIELSEMRRSSRNLPEHLTLYADVAMRLVDRAGSSRVQVFHHGLGEMLSRPEFASNAQPNLAAGERLRRVVDFLQQGLAMEVLLSQMALENGVQVVIGGETPLEELEDYALVVGRYGGHHDGTGVLGVLGPTRMDYGGAISLVRYMTELMTDLVFGR